MSPFNLVGEHAGNDIVGEQGKNLVHAVFGLIEPLQIRASYVKNDGTRRMLANLNI
jgi:hypothetical protein